MIQGQGDTTEYKERGIQEAIELNLRAVYAVPWKYASRFPYHHLDLNCGSGWNEEANCIGSPIAALRAMANVNKANYDSWFCDKSEQAVKRLLCIGEIAGNPRCVVVHGDNHEVLDMFAESIRLKNNCPSYAGGTILVDPNGCFYDNAVPVNELAAFAKEFPRIDLILNLNEYVNSCVRGNIRKGNGKWRPYVDIPDLPDFLSRKHWLIRQPIQKNGHRFVMLIGRNFRISDNRAWGLYHLDSRDGRAIMERIKGGLCNTTPTTNISGTLCFEP